MSNKQEERWQEQEQEQEKKRIEFSTMLETKFGITEDYLKRHGGTIVVDPDQMIECDGDFVKMLEMRKAKGLNLATNKKEEEQKLKA